ncbi:hypothetical protein [Streptomyces sp. NPDC001389]
MNEHVHGAALTDRVIDPLHRRIHADVAGAAGVASRRVRVAGR